MRKYYDDSMANIKNNVCAMCLEECIDVDHSVGKHFCFKCKGKLTSSSDSTQRGLEQTKDQSIKADAGKPRLHLVPTEIINCIARVREFGNKKYKDSNSWKRVEKERYIDAMFRHLLKYVNDNNSVDEESGMPHLWHLACNVAFLCEMEQTKE